MSFPRVNLPIAVIAFGFWWLETKYFGWNSSPGSPEEVIADGIALVIWALAFGFGKRPVTVTIINQRGDA